MLRLYTEHKFDEKLPTCRKERVEREKTPEELDHEIFCCKKEIFRHFDANDDEVAITAEYTPTKSAAGPQRVISRLRVDNRIYDLELV